LEGNIIIGFRLIISLCSLELPKSSSSAWVKMSKHNLTGIV
jgi:hypothetical protein